MRWMPKDSEHVVTLVVVVELVVVTLVVFVVFVVIVESQVILILFVELKTSMIYICNLLTLTLLCQ